MTQWEALIDCPLYTENYGEFGYIYQDKRCWIAVSIDEDGEETDTVCQTIAEAKHLVELEGE